MPTKFWKLKAVKRNIIILKAIFSKDSSWVLKNAVKDSELLQHEKLHFDITEIFARKCRKELRAIEVIQQNVPKI